MKKVLFLAIIFFTSLLVMTSCMQRLQNEGGSTADPTAEPTQSESEGRSEHIDENQGGWDTEVSASDDPSSEEPTADPETHHDENQGEWDVE